VRDFLFVRCEDAGRNINGLSQLVLLDLKLPGINGLEVLKQIRDKHEIRCLAIIILTSSDEGEDSIGSCSDGARSYIRKAVDFEQFKEAFYRLGLYGCCLTCSPGRVPQLKLMIFNIIIVQSGAWCCAFLGCKIHFSRS